MDLTLLPGFALKSSMFELLELPGNHNNIDNVGELSWDETIDELSTKITPGSVAIGYSQGGRIALGLGTKYPRLFSGLVLISTHAGLNENEQHERKNQDRIFYKELLNNRSKVLGEFDRKEIFDSSAEIQELTNKYRITDTTIISEQLRNLGTGSMPYLENKLNTIPIPIMYIVGTRDKKFKQLARRYHQQSAFSYMFEIDSDHRVPFCSPKVLSLYIKWFTHNVL